MTMPDETTPVTILRYNVVAVNSATGGRRILAADKTPSDAEAVVKMAVIRLGVDEEFYIMEPQKNRVTKQ